MSASWFLVSTYLILDLWVQIDSVKQPIKRDSVGTDHLDYCFVVFKSVKQGAEVSKFCVCHNVIDIDQFKIISVGVFLRSGWCVFWIVRCRTSLPELVAQNCISRNNIRFCGTV